MNAVLWVIQIVLAVVFLGSGLAKVLRPKEQVRARMAWVDDFSQPMMRFIGTVEALAAIGLVPVLTPLAAVGLVVVMIGAVATHLRRHEAAIVPANLVLLLLAAVVVWGRFGPYHV